jgi:hypothetical protein
MKDQYPMVAPFVKYNTTLDKYVLEVEVNDKKPIDKFLKGLHVDINTQ